MNLAHGYMDPPYPGTRPRAPRLEREFHEWVRRQRPQWMEGFRVVCLGLAAPGRDWDPRSGALRGQRGAGCAAARWPWWALRPRGPAVRGGRYPRLHVAALRVPEAGVVWPTPRTTLAGWFRSPEFVGVSRGWALRPGVVGRGGTAVGGFCVGLGHQERDRKPKVFPTGVTRPRPAQWGARAAATRAGFTVCGDRVKVQNAQRRKPERVRTVQDRPGLTWTTSGENAQQALQCR